LLWVVLVLVPPPVIVSFVLVATVRVPGPLERVTISACPAPSAPDRQTARTVIAVRPELAPNRNLVRHRSP